MTSLHNDDVIASYSSSTRYNTVYFVYSVFCVQCSIVNAVFVNIQDRYVALVQQKAMRVLYISLSCIVAVRIEPAEGSTMIANFD